MIAPTHTCQPKGARGWRSEERDERRVACWRVERERLEAQAPPAPRKAIVGASRRSAALAAMMGMALLGGVSPGRRR